VTVTRSLDFNGDGQVNVSGDAAHLLVLGSVSAFGASPASASTALFSGLFTIQGGPANPWTLVMGKLGAPEILPRHLTPAAVCDRTRPRVN
jgi:hypothetical protein